MTDGVAVRVRTRMNRVERREQILRAAAEVFQGRDPADVTFEEIADAAGVSRALVSNYFGDRGGLVEAVYQRHVEALRARVDEALQSARGCREAMRRLVRLHLEYAASDPAGYRYAARQTTFGPLRHGDERPLADMATAYGDGPEADLLATGTVAAIRAMTMRWLDGGAPDIARAEELIFHFLWTGISRISDLGVGLSRWWAS